MENWEKFEKYVQRSLNLDSTVSSGNQWNDPGDAVDRTHFSIDPYKLIVDCKYTERKGFRLESAMLKTWVRNAVDGGYIFGLPIRFHENGKNSDYIVLTLEDFSDIFCKAKENNSKGE